MARQGAVMGSKRGCSAVRFQGRILPTSTDCTLDQRGKSRIQWLTIVHMRRRSSVSVHSSTAATRSLCVCHSVDRSTYTKDRLLYSIHNRQSLPMLRPHRRTSTRPGATDDPADGAGVRERGKIDHRDFHHITAMGSSNSHVANRPTPSRYGSGPAPARFVL